MDLARLCVMDHTFDDVEAPPILVAPIVTILATLALVILAALLGR
jgi:hypothetical protein